MAATAHGLAAAGTLTASRRIGGMVVAVVLGLAWMSFGPAFLGGPMSMVIVSGNSMDPTMEDGDLAVVREGSNYAVGDVVAFRSDPEDGGGFVIHRIVGGSEAAGFAMRGDNNDWLDPWEPTSTDIVGELQWHVPGGGVWLSRIRGWLVTPLVMASLVGAAAVMFGAPARRRRRRRARTNRRRERTMLTRMDRGGRPTARRSTRERWGTRDRAFAAAGVVGALLVVAAAPSVWAAWRIPTTAEGVASGDTGQARIELSYTAVAKGTSPVYPEGQVGPVIAPDTTEATVDSGTPAGAPVPDGGQESAEVAPPQPLFTQMIERIDLGVKYALSTTGDSADLAGTYAADLEIHSAEGWSTTVEALPETAFDGTSTAFEVPIVLDSVAGRLAAYAAATGRSVESYRVVVRPRIELSGTLAGEPVEEGLTAELPLDVGPEQIVPGGQLVSVADVDTTRHVVEAASTDVLGLSLPVARARLMTSVLLGVGLVLAVGCAAQLGRRHPHLRHRVMHGSLLVDVDGGTDDDQVLPVRDMRQLVRLAQRDGRSILHQDMPGGGHRYFVPDGQVTYEHLEGGSANDGSRESTSPQVVRLQTVEELTRRWMDPRSGDGAAIRRQAHADGVVRCSLEAGDTLYVVDVPLTDLMEDTPTQVSLAAGRPRLNGHGTTARGGA